MRCFFSCVNPLKAQFPKKNNACISPPLLSLLNNFETSLRLSITKLILKDDDKNAFLTVSWMIQAMRSLCETHQSIKTLVTDLNLLVSHTEESLMYAYSDISSKLLQLCDAFILELDRINHVNLLLKLAFSNAEEFSLSQFNCWRQLMASKNPSIENCGEVLSSLVESMNRYHRLYKKKQSEKVKVFMRALYGVMVKTLYICSVFAAAFSGSSKNILYLTIPKEMEEVPWEQAFMELQNMINREIKNTLFSDKFTGIKDIQAVESGAEKLYAEVQKKLAPNMLMAELLKRSVIEISERFDIISNETRCLRETMISAREALFKRGWNKI